MTVSVRVFLLAIAFPVFALLAYAPALQSSFIWDDDVLLTDNPYIKAPNGLPAIWTSAAQSDYFPLTATTFWLEWRLWGMNPVGYNVTNVLLHAASGLLLWRLLRCLNIPGAWLGGMIFLLHPVCVASVAWVAERKNTLSMLFYLLTLLAWERFEQKPSRPRYAAAFGLFVLALLAKTSVVVLPLVPLLLAWWKRARIASVDVLRVVPFLGASLVFGCITVWFQSHEVLLGDASPNDPMIVRVLGGTWGLWFYLSKAIWPQGLAMVYAHWNIDPGRVVSYAPAVLWIALLAVLWRHRSGAARAAFLAIAYFTLALLPVLGFFDMSFLLYSRVADHWQYLALPGIAALAAGALVSFGPRMPVRAPLLPALYGIILVCAGVLTFRHAGVFTNQETLWRDTVQKTPTAWIAWHNLADALAEQQRFTEAAQCYSRALHLKPDHAKTHNNRGNVLSILGDFDAAISNYLDAIQYKPELAEAHKNLGVILSLQGRLDEAMERFEEAIRLKPDFAEAHFQAGNVHFKREDLARAADHYFSVIRASPNHADAHYNLGIVLGLLGRREQAMLHLRRVLEIRPEYADAVRELDELLQATE